MLPQSDTEAYLWAKKAAEAGLAKAQYAVGYFTEVSHAAHRVVRRDIADRIDWNRSRRRSQNSHGMVQEGSGCRG